MARLLLGVSDGEERSTRRSVGLFIPVTAGTSRPRGGQFMICDGGVKGPPLANHNTSSYLPLHTPRLK